MEELVRQVAISIQATRSRYPDSRNYFCPNETYEIGCVEYNNKKRTPNTFMAYVHPKRLNSHQLDEVFGCHCSSSSWFGDTAETFLSFIFEAELILLNSDNDILQLNAELRRLERHVLVGMEVKDTGKIIEQYIPNKRRHFIETALMLGIDIFATKTMVDCAGMIGDVYIRLEGKQLHLNLEGGWSLNKKQLVS